MVCGFGDAVSYENLAAKLAGARIDKSSRFTDWAHRPLTDRQLQYALSDVTHLRPTYEHLARRLAKTGRTDWVAEEMAVLTNPNTYRLEPREAWRRIKFRNDKARPLAILREVAAWREEEAQRRDLPRNRVLRDETLCEIAAHAPSDVEHLARCRGLLARPSPRTARGPRSWPPSSAGWSCRPANARAHPAPRPAVGHRPLDRAAAGAAQDALRGP